MNDEYGDLSNMSVTGCVLGIFPGTLIIGGYLLAWALGKDAPEIMLVMGLPLLILGLLFWFTKY